MPNFSKPEKIAQKAVKQLKTPGEKRENIRNTDKIPSDTSSKHAERAFTGFERYLQANKLGNIYDANPDKVKSYLDERSQKADPVTLNQEREALNKWLYHVNQNQVPKNEIKEKGQQPGRELSKKSRYYTKEQVDKIQEAQTEKNALATKVAYEAGLRAHELQTIAKPSEQPPDKRPWRQDRFIGKEQDEKTYTVIGKGGLIREITISKETAQHLEQRRLMEPKNIMDRNKKYTVKYDIGKGNSWSASFTKASKRQLGWSKGAHGLRHSYAQERMNQLQNQHYTYSDARQVVSQELGHFDISKTNDYLR